MSKHTYHMYTSYVGFSSCDAQQEPTPADADLAAGLETHLDDIGSPWMI